MKHAFLLTLLAVMAHAQSTPAAGKAAPAATKSATKAAPKSTTAAKAAPKAAPAMDLLKPSTVKGSAPSVFRAKLTTTKGDVIIEVHKAWAPAGADRFYNLVRAGYFTDSAFFRVVSGFMAQFGISARPEVNKIWSNQNLIDDRPTQSNKRGRVTFAATGAPNSRSTQMFINFKDNSFLDSMGFAPFGEVVEGMENVDKFYNGYGEAPSGQQDRINAEGKAFLDKTYPKVDRILSATIVPMPAPAAPAAAAPATATPAPAATKK
jgi:peptidyl-prolyl cis-trans isomerase A (cyclophilin A)